MKRKNIIILAVFMMLTFVGLLSVQMQYSTQILAMREKNFDDVVKRSLYIVSKTLEQEEAMSYLSEAFEKEQGVLSQEQLSYFEQSDSLSKITTIQNISKKQQKILNESFARKKIILTNVAMKWFNEAPNKRLEERIDVLHVENLIAQELDNNAIKTPFLVSFIDFEGNFFGSDVEAESDTLIEEKEYYSQRLFTEDSDSKMNFMRVRFPEKKKYIMHSIAPVSVFSILSTLMLFGVFISVIVLMVRQRKLSDNKTEFMHNMTHELKTPISSISLASQMLNDDSVANSDKMRKYLTSVITEETKRLSFQVEKVLQISLLENEESILKFKPMDIHAIIESVVKNFEIKVTSSGGKLITVLEAENHIAEVDEMHFTNIMYNLLDNSVKYSRQGEPIKLKIKTWDNENRKHMLSISVEDNGIGIPNEYKNRIFEKFQRVPTGNIHNVKGFGLGLAYVKKMIALHGGTIDLESTLGVGTKFIINLPTKL